MFPGGRICSRPLFPGEVNNYGPLFQVGSPVSVSTAGQVLTVAPTLTTVSELPVSTGLLA